MAEKKLQAYQKNLISFFGFFLDESELTGEKLKAIPGKKLGIAYLDLDEVEVENKETREKTKIGKWSWKGKREATELQKLKLITKSVKEAVKFVMMTHLYPFNKQVYRQEEGGRRANRA